MTTKQTGGDEESEGPLVLIDRGHTGPDNCPRLDTCEWCNPLADEGESSG